MTTLDFADMLVENTFSFGNMYVYDHKTPYGLYFSKESQNYPFILKGGQSDDFELEFSYNTHQLRSRLLNTKKIKEVMNSAKIPLYFVIKQIPYLIGKGFLSTFDPAGNHQPLFMACVDGMKNITSIQQVKFYVSKMVFEDRHKAVRTAVEDLIKGHSGDVIQCNNILDYVGEKLIFPRGGSLSELSKYKQAVIRTCLMQDFVRGNPEMEPFVIESNRGPVSIVPDAVSIGADGSFTVEPESGDLTSILRTLRSFTVSELESTVSSSGTTDDLTTAMTIAILGTPSAVTRGLVEGDPPYESAGAELPF